MEVNISDHEQIKRLVALGVREALAEQFIKIIDERKQIEWSAIKVELAKLATKEELNLLRQEFHHFRKQIETYYATKGDLKGESNSIIKWVIGMGVTIIIVVVGVIVWLLQLLKLV